jgi:hypothetical protein
MIPNGMLRGPNSTRHQRGQLISKNCTELSLAPLTKLWEIEANFAVVGDCEGSLHRYGSLAVP